jgi:hypothetical protein
VLFGKGGRSRTVGIDPGGLAHVRAWPVLRPSLGIDASRPVFCIVQGTAWGGALDTGYVRLTFKRLAVSARPAKRIRRAFLRAIAPVVRQTASGGFHAEQHHLITSRIMRTLTEGLSRRKVVM